MFFCLWAALFCYVSVRGCRNERVRAKCTAFNAVDGVLLPALEGCVLASP